MRLGLFISTFLFTLASLGATAPVTRLQGKDLISDKDMKISVDHGKGTIVVFLSSHCACSKSHISHLSSLKKEFPDFELVGVNSNSDEGDLESQKYFQDLKPAFPILRDGDGKIADELGAVRTPQVFVLNTKGEVVFYGGVSNSSDCSHADKFFLKNALKTISEGKTPEPKYARALGCQITR